MYTCATSCQNMKSIRHLQLELRFIENRGSGPPMTPCARTGAHQRTHTTQACDGLRKTYFLSCRARQSSVGAHNLPSCSPHVCYKPTKYEGQPPLATRVMDRLRSGVPGLSPPSRPCPRCTASPATANWSECAPRPKSAKSSYLRAQAELGELLGILKCSTRVEMRLKPVLTR